MINRTEVQHAASRVRSELARLLDDPGSRAAFSGRVKRRLKRDWLARSRSRSSTRDFPEVSLPLGPINRPQLRVAVILDQFSATAFFYEWDQDPVPRQGWQEHVEKNPPDVLFVESAWAGNDRAWRLTMTGTDGPASDLVDLVRWCQQRDIPTVFWNKEDPPNYDVFKATAALFDYVFTVDADRIPAYQADLGHDRIFLLPFAAQPRIHNPIRRPTTTMRRVAFAGTYFAQKHPGRRAQMDILLPAAGPLGLDIFSRMQGKDKRYQFPSPYDRSVIGSLTYQQMLGAATAYRVFLNVNSVTASPSMCSRRLFELSAAQTAVLSTPAAAIEPYFDDTITVARDTAGAETALKLLLDQDEYRDRLALRAHRHVFDKHLYTHRVQEVLQTVGLSR
ncbi:MAG: glycosyltransferase, partial [Ornithinimicrobium sp.]